MSDLNARIRKLEELQLENGNKTITWVIVKYDCDGTEKTSGPIEQELKLAEEEYIRRFGETTTNNIATLTVEDDGIYGKDVLLVTYPVKDNSTEKKPNQAEQISNDVKFVIGKGYVET